MKTFLRKHFSRKNKKTIFKLLVAGKIIITLGVLSAGVITKNSPSPFEKIINKQTLNNNIENIAKNIPETN